MEETIKEINSEMTRIQMILREATETICRLQRENKNLKRLVAEQFEELSQVSSPFRNEDYSQ